MVPYLINVYVIVLQSCTLSEQGDRNDLIVKDGLYASLYSANYASFNDNYSGAFQSCFYGELSTGFSFVNSIV